MKKQILLILLALCILAMMLTGCGGEAAAQQNNESQIQELTDAYNSLKSEYDQLESDYLALQEEYSKLQADYDILNIKTESAVPEPAAQSDAEPDTLPEETVPEEAVPAEDAPADQGEYDLYEDDMLRVTFLDIYDSPFYDDEIVLELELLNKTDSAVQVMLENTVVNGYSTSNVPGGNIQPGTLSIPQFTLYLSDFHGTSADDVQNMSFDIVLYPPDEYDEIHRASIELALE